MSSLGEAPRETGRSGGFMEVRVLRVLIRNVQQR